MYARWLNGKGKEVSTAPSPTPSETGFASLVSTLIPPAILQKVASTHEIMSILKDVLRSHGLVVHHRLRRSKRFFIGFRSGDVAVVR